MGCDSWAESVKGTAGNQVRYRIQFKNTGDVELKNVVIRDVLPKGVSYVKGSTVLYNAANTNGKTMNDDIVSDKGLNIGNYAKGTEATIYFYATISSDFADNCEGSTLTNTASGKYNNDDKTTKPDTADVTLDGKVCEDKPEEPVTPPELPKTGAENVLSAMVAIAGLTTATAYYIASRKK